MFEKLFLFSAEASSEAGETITEATQLITTEYSDLKVPTGTLIFLVAAMVLLIAVAVACFIVIKRHCVNWGMTIMTAAASFLLFSYLAYNAVFYALGMIPAVREQLNTNGTLLILLFLLFCLITDFLAVFLGMKYVVSQNTKRNLYYDLGTPAVFALSIYAVSLFIEIPNSLTAAPLNGFFNYFTLFSTINTSGFDPFVNSLIQNGMASADVVEQLVDYMSQSIWSYVFETFWAISRLVFFLSACVLIYGVLREKLEKKMIGLAAAVILLSLLPKTLVYFGLHPIIATVMALVFAAAVFYYTLMIVKKQMPEELERVSHKIDNSYNKRNQNKNKPMPKIVMPKD